MALGSAPLSVSPGAVVHALAFPPLGLNFALLSLSQPNNMSAFPWMQSENASHQTDQAAYAAALRASLRVVWRGKGYSGGRRQAPGAGSA